MALIHVRHKVNDYKAWKQVFDGFIEKRKAGGEKGFVILRGVEDPNNLFIIFEWDSPENAHKFMSSEGLKAAMQKGGVAEPPQIDFVTLADKGSL
ncbi:MAG: cyclase [bacterium]